MRALGTLRPVGRDIAAYGLKAQLPGHRGVERRVSHVGREVREILGLRKEDRRDKCRTELSASTFAGGRRKDGDDFHYPEGSTRFVAECDLPTDRGTFRLRAYTYRGAKVVVRDGENVLEWTEMEPVIIYKGNLRGNTKVVVRVHDQCYTSEVLGSKRCDCREQLELALDYINQHGGALVYMPQEGRGIGLANKIAAYQLQDGGLDTVDANRALGFGDDERDYACVPYMLNDMGIKGIRLMTNNPFKIRTLTELGVNIIGSKAHVVASNEFNAKYLRTKAARMAHVLPVMENGVADADAATSLALTSRAKEAKQAAAALDVRWRFGKKSVEAAAKAVASGSAVMMVDGSRHNEGWLVASAEAISTGTLGILNQLGDSVSVPVAQETVEAIETHWPDCRAAYQLDDDLSLEELASVFATMGNTVDMSVVRQLFEELDVNKDGKVSLQEFTQGLQSVPVSEDLGVLKGLLRSLSLDDLKAPSARQGVLDGRVDFLHRLAATAAAATSAKASALLKTLPLPLAAVLGETLSSADETLSSQSPRESPATPAPQESITWQGIQDHCIAHRLLPVRSKTDALLLPARSPGDAAVELARMARQAPLAVLSPLLDELRLDSMSFAQLVEFSKERGFVITSVEDVVCYRSENFELPSFFESKRGTS